MIIAQITDMHVKRQGRRLYQVIDTGKHLRRCVDYINQMTPLPDIVLATGDLVDGGKQKEYQRLRKLLDALQVPVLLVPGNHDRRDRLRQEFSDYPHIDGGGEHIHYVAEDYPLRLIGLDTTEPGHAGGFLDAARLDWIEARLTEAPARPTLLFMHHPPFRTGIRAMDALGFVGVGRFAEIVARHRQIQRIVAGHIHRVMHVRWQGTVASVAPSTAYQLVLARRSEQPLGFSVEAPGFAVHVWAQGRLLTHRISVAH